MKGLLEQMTIRSLNNHLIFMNFLLSNVQYTDEILKCYSLLEPNLIE